MKLSFKPKEIDDHVLKLTVGFVALSLATVTKWLSASDTLGSISAAYYEGDWARNVFVGFLFAISSFMFAYNGDNAPEMILSKVAAVAGLGVALFPCHCNEPPTTMAYVHYTFAAIMFIVLAGLCVIFYRRARAQGHAQAIVRSYIYGACAITIVLVIAVLGIDNFLLDNYLGKKEPRLTFYGERTALIAFGIAWLVASKVFPGITKKSERVSLLPVK